MAHLVRTDSHGNRTVSFIRLSEYRSAQHQNALTQRRVQSRPKPRQSVVEKAVGDPLINAEPSANLLPLPQIQLILSTPTDNPADPRSSVLATVTLHLGELEPRQVLSKPQHNTSATTQSKDSKTISYEAIMENFQKQKNARLAKLRQETENSLVGFRNFQQEHPKIYKAQTQAHATALDLANANPINFYPIYQKQYQKALVQGVKEFVQSLK